MDAARLIEFSNLRSGYPLSMISFFRNPKSVGRLRGKLAILVPTYRFDSRARNTLAATVSLASEEVAVLIGDNSENADKWDYLDKLGALHSNIHIHRHKRNIGAARNWRFLLDQTPLAYYLFVGDDDSFTTPYVESAMQLLDENEDASAAAGRFVMVTTANNILTANGARIESTPSQR